MVEPQLNLANIQGNILAGFNKDHQSFLLVAFPADGDPKGWLKQITPDVASTSEVDAFNRLFKTASARRGSEHAVKATWMNLAISASGLQQLGIPQADFEAFPEAFRAGMKGRASEIGDAGASAPEQWVAPFRSTAIHAVILLAADEPDDLDAAALRHIATLGDHGLQLLFKQDGRARTDLPGHEHFGFKDGISQPGVRNFTEPTNPAEPLQGQPGQDLIWAGEFVLGYPGQQKHPNPPGPLPSPPNYQPTPVPEPASETSEFLPGEGEVTTSGPAWTVDGSYLVFRRLRQDVPGFNHDTEQAAGEHGISTELLGAKLIGRYESGCPLEHTNDEETARDPQTGDPSFQDPTLLSDAKINDFEYDQDPDGDIVPRAAHIRKVYPRNEPTPGGGEADTQTHRIMRRGIAYGAPYDPGAPTGSAQAGDVEFPDDRGLLFLCYQHSLENQFEFLQKFWVNNPNFPKPADGQDPIIAQLAEPRSFSAPGVSPTPLSVKQFVTNTGGEYFFSPSISALEKLSSP